MEGDHASPKSPEKPNSGEQATGTRSYDCIFCKRGFSNAQALGGHMNIHRKDKARGSKQPPFDDVRSSVIIKDTSKVRYNDHISASLPFKWPWMIPRDQDNKEDVRREDTGQEDGETTSSVMELDLELRLGPEPSRPTMSLKEFL